MKRDIEESIRELGGHRLRLMVLLRWLVKHKVEERLWPRIEQEDLVQEVFVRAARWMRANDGPEDQVRDLRPWLNQILVNLLNDKLRNLAHAPGEALPLGDATASAMRLDQWLAADHTSPSGRAMRREHEQLLEHAIRHLPSPERQVVEQCWLQKRPHAEVAARIGRTVPAVRGLLRRALDRLADALAALRHSSSAASVNTVNAIQENVELTQGTTQ
jgi:RNA polymerase sigma factor (sigma-70 family)